MLSQTPTEQKTNQYFTDISDLPIRSESKKITVVLDLDETLIYARSGPYYLRNYSQEFIRVLSQELNFEVIVWTMGSEQHAKNSCSQLDPAEKNIHGTVACDHDKFSVNRPKTYCKDYFTRHYCKNLINICGDGSNRTLDTVFIIDNLYENINTYNIDNGILIESFQGCNEINKILQALLVLIKRVYSHHKHEPQNFLKNLLSQQELVSTVVNNGKKIQCRTFTFDQSMQVELSEYSQPTTACIPPVSFFPKLLSLPPLRKLPSLEDLLKEERTHKEDKYITPFANTESDSESDFESDSDSDTNNSTHQRFRRDRSIMMR